MNDYTDLARPEQYLSEFFERDVKWDKHRGDTQLISRIYGDNQQYRKLAERTDSCANRLLFGWADNRTTGESQLKLQQAMFCKVRSCPVCEWRRSMRSVATFFKKVPELEAAYPTHRWLFLTLTVKNCALDDLRSTLAHMNKSWKRMIQRKDWPAIGWIKTVEVTRGANGSAHPHFHVLLLVKPSYFSGGGYVRQEQWVERWQSVARLDYEPVVDIRVIKPKHGMSLHAAAVELLKYGTKVTDALQNPDWLYGITEQLYKARFLASGGALKGLFTETVTDDDLVHADDEQALTEPAADAGQLSFYWSRKVSRYRKST